MRNAVVRAWLVYLFTLLTVAALNIDGVGSWYANRGEGREAVRAGLSTLKDFHSRSGIGPWLTALECAAGPAFEGSYKDKSKCRDLSREGMALARMKTAERETGTPTAMRPHPDMMETAFSSNGLAPLHEDASAASPREVMNEPDGAAASQQAMDPMPLNLNRPPETEPLRGTAHEPVHANVWERTVPQTEDDPGITSALLTGPAAVVEVQFPAPPLEGEPVDAGRARPFSDEGVFEPLRDEGPAGTGQVPGMELASLHATVAAAPDGQPAPNQGLCDESLGKIDFRSVLLVGDSLAHGLALSLGRDLKDRRGAVFSFVAKVSSGLNNPSVFNWEKTMRLLIEQGAPDLVLVMMGVNDANNHIRDGNRLCPVGTPEWGEAYESKVENFLRIAAELNVRVCWIGVPVVREEGLQNRVLLANMAARNACSRVSHCRFIDTFDALCDANRRYTNYIKEPDGSAVRIRAKDGIHFSMEGSNLLSKYILQKLETGGEAAASARN